MSNIYITPIDHPLRASVRVPGSKSLTNRALLIAALGRRDNAPDGRTLLGQFALLCRSPQNPGLRCTSSSPLSAKNGGNEGGEITVTGLGGRIPAKKAELYIGNAGTAARFLSAFLALGSGEYILDGDERMRERPIGDLVEALAQLGAVIEPVLSVSHEFTTVHPLWGQANPPSTNLPAS